VGLSGHFWTIVPTLASRLRPPRPLASSRPWSLPFEDPVVGSIVLTGVETRGRHGGAALLLHGLGGSIDSGYMLRLERSLVERGWTTLRLNLRGADRRGDDLHHAGDTADLPRVLRSAPFSTADPLVIVGVSLGGHVALRYAAEGTEPRAAATVAICSPLDLDRGASALDGRGAWVYRRYVLRAINEVYRHVSERGRAPTALDRVLAARTIREWDGLVVAPRFGFASAEDYYARASVGPLLPRISRPTWIVASEQDPMVPASTLRGALTGASESTEVAWVRRGGHVGFPAALDLGVAGPRGLAPQVAAWIEARL